MPYREVTMLEIKETLRLVREQASVPSRRLAPRIRRHTQVGEFGWPPGVQWPHSGFHVHAGVGVSEDDSPVALRLARYCARNPLALDGPTAGTAALDPIEFLIPVR